MISRPFIFLFLILLLGSSGCGTLVNEKRSAAMRERMDIENQKADVRKMEERIDGIATAQQDLFREIEILRNSREKDNLEFKKRMAEIERTLEASETATEKIRQDVIDDLSKKMAEIMHSQAAHSTRFEKGREHVVLQGETLSAIAAAYGVKVSAIVEANNLENADSVRSGQKLFIPE